MNVGTRVLVRHATGIVEYGTVAGAMRPHAGEVLMLSVHFDDRTYMTVPAFRCTPTEEMT